MTNEIQQAADKLSKSAQWLGRCLGDAVISCPFHISPDDIEAYADWVKLANAGYRDECEQVKKQLDEQAQVVLN